MYAPVTAPYCRELKCTPLCIDTWRQQLECPLLVCLEWKQVFFWPADSWKEQQDAAAHRLQDEVHPVGRPYLHWHLQSLWQAHESDSVRLWRVQEDQVGATTWYRNEQLTSSLNSVITCFFVFFALQAQELKAARERGEESSWSGSATWWKSGLHDCRGPTT